MKKLIVGALLIGLSIVLVAPVQAQQDVTEEQILQSLKPKPRTRGISAPAIKAEDRAFINALPHRTRGLTVEERDRVSEIVAAAALPSIDLEVNFALNSATLEPSAIQTLQKLGTALKAPELENATFLVAGHTDARGAKEPNQMLSEQRAAAVRSFLAGNYQFPSDRLVAVGYGQQQLKNTADPLADENRRVKITNLGKN